MNIIKDDLESLRNIENETQKLNEEIPKSKQRMHQEKLTKIEQMKKNVDNIFKDLSNKVDKKKKIH